MNDTDRPLNLSKRRAKASDAAFARATHHAGYHDVIVKQFGACDHALQDRLFDASWRADAVDMFMLDDAPCGYCCIEADGDCIALRELVVAPAYQRRGIGSAILRELLYAASQSRVPVKLRVLIENPAQRLCRKLGFVETARTITHINMEFQTTALSA